MTVTSGSALPKDDIDRMMREAEEYAEEDRRRREAAETRNQAEQLVYQTERFLRDSGDKVPDGTRSEVEAAVAELKALLERNADTPALRDGVEKLASVSQRMGQAMYAQGGPEPGAAGGEQPTGQPTGPRDEEGVVDAEIVDDDKDTKGPAA
jgi:molecular chaperone DnaK